MSSPSYNIPEFGYVNETTSSDYLVPGAAYVNETVSVAPPTLSLFRVPSLTGIGSGGPFFQNPLGA